MAGEGAEATIQPGRTGSFEITREGALVFSKLETGRFPEEDEILAMTQGAAPAGSPPRTASSP